MFGTQSYGRRGLALLTSLLLILLQLAAPLGALATETADVPAVYVSYTDANGLTGSAMGQLAVGEDGVILLLGPDHGQPYVAPADHRGSGGRKSLLL